MGSENRNNLPSFSKAVRGYDTEEVDAYVAYANERYQALSRENADLKRKLTKFMLGLDRRESESEKPAVSLPDTAQINNLLRDLDECAARSREIEKAIMKAISLAEELKLEGSAAGEVPPESKPAPKREAQSEKKAEKKSRPADELASVDFYTNEVHADGTEYDSMTLARKSTERKKSSISELMFPVEKGEDFNK